VRGLRKRELRLRLAETETRLQAVHQELAERTLRDPLTGLHTPQAFIQRLDGEVERSRRYGRPLSLAALDVDGFGSLNRAHGRDERVLVKSFFQGDEYLYRLVKALSGGQ